MRRRDFMRRAAWGTAAAAAVMGGRRVRGANERVNVGLIGCGGRGRRVARLMREAPNVAFTAVCDVYDRRADGARDWAGGDCRAYRDFRRLLDRKDIDAVLIATPDHWHAIPTVMACAAGKDVYVEKPLAHNVVEGRAMVEAAHRHGRIVQVGTQHRSADHFAEAARIVQDGRIGRVHLVRIWTYMNIAPDGIGRKPDSPAPAGLDWEMYLGPAPLAPFNPNRFGPTYRWFFDYSGGLVTDYGVHRFDSLHQIMDVRAPRTISAAGGRLLLDDGGDVPDVLHVSFEYACPRTPWSGEGFVVSYEACALNAHGVGGRSEGMRYYRAYGEHDRPSGLAFYGTDGALFVDRIGYEIYPEPGRAPIDPGAARRASRDRTDLHAANFIECVRSRNRPAADIETGHRATTVALLGNIAYHTGRKLRWDADAERFVGDAEADGLLRREARPPWDLI